MAKQYRLLLLGAMPTHVPLIQRAKERGIYVITTDYIPENIGHKYSDEAYYVSTTDKDAVLELAKKCKVDGVMTFCSDPAASTAAYVSEMLNLPSSGYEAVSIMTHKELFRSFLHENGFNCPHFQFYDNIESAKLCINEFSFPFMVKPVDSSGSKGVAKVSDICELKPALAEAFRYSRSNRIIIEDVIEPKGPQIHGSAFVQDGKVVFCQLGDHHFDPEINNLLPISTTWPSTCSENELQFVKEELQRFVSAIGYKQGGIDLETRINIKDNKLYLIEVGPRNGGDYIPTVMQYYSGVNLSDACINAALGLPIQLMESGGKKYYCYYVIHSKIDGMLEEVRLSEMLRNHVVEKHDYISIGEKVYRGTSSQNTIGILVLGFDSHNEMLSLISNCGEHCRVIIA